MPGPRRQGRRALRAGTRFSGSSLDTPCSLLKFLVWMREKSSSSPFGGMLKSSFRQISSYLIVISRKKSSPLRAKTQAVADRAHAKTRPHPHRPATARIPSPPSCLKPLYLGVARDPRRKTNAPAPRRGFSHRPRNDIRAALALVAVPHADAPADRDCRAKI